MPFDYDILIVGAGPAGCAAAYDLARAGKRVLLLEKRSFPRHKACACGLTRKTLKALRYSVGPVIECVCHEIVLQQATGDASRREVRVKTRNPICAMAVRERFDDFCLHQTLAAGASLKKIETIAALRELSTHIELDIVTATGTETLRAPILIGADGSNGQTRRLAERLTAQALKERNLNSAAPSNATPNLPAQTFNGSSSNSAAPSNATPNLPANVLQGTTFSSAIQANKEQGALAPEEVAANTASQSSTQNKHPLAHALKGTGFSPSIQANREQGALAPEALSTEPPWYKRGFALEATVPYTALPAILPAGDAPHDLLFDFAPLPGGYGWLFPKGDHINIGVGAFSPNPNAGWPIHARSLRMGGMQTAEEANLKQVTRALLNQYALKKLGITDLPHITGQYLGMGGEAYVPCGRVLLTGDAAGLVDPLTGEGIHSALVSGQAAAAAILSSKSDVAAAYARHLKPLQQTLAFSARAARAFYATPERGFKAMRIPLMRSLVLKTYADGLPYTSLLTGLAKLVT
jgi:flavin-dependent dehydrogenase